MALGEKMIKGKVGYSKKPYKIASKVKEFALGGSDHKMGTTAVILKKNNKAYGWGSNSDYALTSKYKKGWINKLVLLKSNIKHVYAGYDTTLLLDNKKRLYWAGTTYYTGLIDWVDIEE